MATVMEAQVREQLLDRRRRLEGATAAAPGVEQIHRLIQDVDAALERLNQGTYGLCKECHDPIEPERLMANPLEEFCVDHLTEQQKRRLEEDVELAARIQGALLPGHDLRVPGWEVSFHYEPAGMVSGDHCDLLRGPDGRLYFLVGDVMGKGIAASMLMAHLQATFRALVSLGLPLDRLMERASRVFCESTLPSHFATMVCGTAGPGGEVEFCNAGHPPPLVAHAGKAVGTGSTSLPLGLFCDGHFPVHRLQLSPGDTILLFTDGITETRNRQGEEFGTARLALLLEANPGLAPAGLVPAVVREVAAFRAGPSKADDLTVMAIRRVEG